MIQRIQSFWLLLTAVCAFATLKLPFYSGNKIADQAGSYQSVTGNTTILLNIITVAIGIIALVFIFLYKNRKQQLWLTLLLLLVSLLQLFLLYLQTKQFVQGAYEISVLVYIAMPAWLILAMRGMYKDEQLVKSVDRLR
ncbi:MAG: DUF4293 family protein [Hydrotalea flava]|nr:DUF4293 family protein [Hydrotalea flava]NIM38376.1 DUF4293 family protein [Hydrotalea flava]NIN03546.1 DUF4293 family protein [Hydrotalea flava]NIN15233.1 DUF4293 family protein [Hydrotalea flava]NIO94302.1 DUF4293 family protein [Hydrotalea flava]